MVYGSCFVWAVLLVACTGEHELVEELFEQIKPGLSSYASDPRKVYYLCHVYIVEIRL